MIDVEWVMMLALYRVGASALEGVRCCEWRWGDSHDGNAVEANCLVLAYSLALSRSLHLNYYVQLEFRERFDVCERTLQLLKCDRLN